MVISDIRLSEVSGGGGGVNIKITVFRDIKTIQFGWNVPALVGTFRPPSTEYYNNNDFYVSRPQT
jgi:hypothetical protein